MKILTKYIWLKSTVVRKMAYNGSGLNEVCLAQPFNFTTTLHRHISFKPLLWDVFLKISGGKSLNQITMSNEKKELTAEDFWNSQAPMKSIPDAIREYHELKTREEVYISVHGEQGMRMLF
jgi:hypothetical protein